MDIINQLDHLLPMATSWVEEQEKLILEQGIPLDTDLKIDAYEIGVKNIDKVRLLKVAEIPPPWHPVLKTAGEIVGLVSSYTAGIAFRYGIYIRDDHWLERRLVVHELTHTMQYERMGGIESFLRRYLYECITQGYPNGALEQEAIAMESKFK